MKKNIKKLLVISVLSLVGCLPASKCSATVSPTEDPFNVVERSVYIRRARGIAGKPGEHTDDYQKARELYEQNSLNKTQFEILKTWIRVCRCTPGYILSPLKQIIRENGLPKLTRIEVRQRYALYAYISRNWTELMPIFMEKLNSVGKLPPIELFGIIKRPDKAGKGLDEFLVRV